VAEAAAEEIPAVIRDGGKPPSSSESSANNDPLVVEGGFRDGGEDGCGCVSPGSANPRGTDGAADAAAAAAVAALPALDKPKDDAHQRSYLRS